MEISAVILTKNEEKNIKDCLKQLDWCDEIVVIDGYSTDKTVKLAKDLGARVYQRELENDFSKQRNFALSQAKGKWVFFVDCDEKVGSGLKKEIISLIKKERGGDYSGFYIQRKDKFLGSWLNYGETRAVSLLRLAKKDVGQWQGKVHEVWQVKGRVKKLKNKLLHIRNISTAEFLTRINDYSSLRADELFQQGQKTNFFFILTFPLGKFIHNYIIRLGFLDGLPGLAMALMMSLHSFLARAKLYFLWQEE